MYWRRLIQMLPAIQNRRSVRFYKNEPVSDADITEVIKAGFCAPSAHAAFPCHVIVIKDQAAKDKLSGIHRWSKIVARAPIVLAVCVDRPKSERFWIEDGAAFMENMLIQATELGLGACWVGIRGLKNEDADAEQSVREVCNLPEHIGVICLMAVGHPARYPGPHEPKLPEGRVHYDRFSVT